MAQTVTMPRLVEARAATIEMVRNVTGGFDIDAFHVMEERDNALIADEILHGAGSDTFVYNFEIQGKQVAGVSVVGARHLANHYRGLKHRLVASMQKTGELFMFQSFPAENMPMSVSASIVHELASEPDFYSAIVEITDIKTGNAIQVERREARQAYRHDGSPYDRPNYQVIAQSKAYRNAVLTLVPQDVVIRWKAEMLKLKKGETITASVIDEKRSNVLRFAAQKGIGLDRTAIEHLTLDQIAGLGDAAREGQLPAFVNAAKALGLEMQQGEPEQADAVSTAGTREDGESSRRRGRPPGPRRQQPPEESGRAASQSGDDAGAGSIPPAEPVDAGQQAMQQQPTGGTAAPKRGVNFEV